MERELHPAGAHVEGPTPTRGGAPPPPDDPAATRNDEALPDAETTPSRPPLPGEAPPETETTHPQPLDPGGAPLDQITEAAASPARTTRSQTLDLTLVHPSQTRFTCPVCKLTYHHSLVRHVGVSHARLKFNISFQCALCEYVNTNLRATANHYRLTHGAAVPPPRGRSRVRRKSVSVLPANFPI